MKRTILFLFCLFSAYLTNPNINSVFAKAPTTPKIAFSSTRDGNSEIYMMNPDGSDLVNLTRDPARDHNPIWSPTGEHIVFNSDRDGERDIYIMDANGKNVRKVFRKSAYREYPVWSPDGESIAYTQPWAIYVASIDGDDVQQIAQTGWLGGSPAWSPDGTHILFTLTQAIHPGSYQFQLVNLRTRAQKTIHPKAWLRMRDAAWSPDGEKIAFAHIPILRRDVHKGTIYMMDRFGKELRQVVPVGRSRASMPVWSPDGAELLYQRRDGDHTQLFKINLHTGISQKLTRRGVNYAADWFDPATLPVQPQADLLTTTWGQLKQK